MGSRASMTELRGLIQAAKEEKPAEDAALWWDVADNMAGDVAQQLELFARDADETVRMIDVALKAKPMARAGALKKARSVAVKAAQEAARVAEVA